MGSVQTIRPQGTTIVPIYYPKKPTPGKLEILFTANKQALWHKLSPYTDFDSSTLLNKVFGDTEPFYYVFADEETGINALRRYQTSVFPVGSAPIDVIRVSKFLASGRGIGFLATQALLQRTNAFNETRIYNPLSPIAAAGMALTLNQVRPQRFIDTSGGLAGVAGSLLGNVGTAIGSAIFGAPKTNPPAGTVGAGALPFMGENNGKGLLRSGTANTAKSLLELKWPITSGNSGGGGISGLLNTVKGLAQGLFDNFVTPSQKDITKRSDEGTYGRMLAAGSLQTTNGDIRFGYYGNSQPFPFLQRWVGGGKSKQDIRKNDEYPQQAGRLFVKPDGTPNIKSDKTVTETIGGGVDLPAGYVVEQSNKTLRPGYRYGDVYGKQSDKDGVYGSDIMVQFKDYSTSGHSNDFPTKKTDAASVEYINSELKKILQTIPKIGNGNIYTINLPTNAKAITSPNRSQDGYNQLFITTQGQDKARGVSPMNYPLGLMSDYTSTRTVDETIKPKGLVEHATYKLPTNGTFDAINTLEVLDEPRSVTTFNLPNWPTWEPYKDDLIALYFYDVVNKKYIPFRASIKGLTESGNASWEELPFIGRADKVYSYGGFNRNLSLNIRVVMGSIVELQPTWKRINYMATVIKPSNYTSAPGSKTTDRFVVPPMFFLTVGDVYRDQPVLFQSVTITVPDDAAWETLNEDNSDDWSYLVNYIKSPGSAGKFGQVPREVELAFSLILLEKERAVVGGANFGHAPRLTDNNQNWVKWNTNTPLGKNPSSWYKGLVVDVMGGGYV